MHCSLLEGQRWDDYDYVDDAEDEDTVDGGVDGGDDGVDRQLVRMGYRLLVRGCKGL